MLKRSCGRIFLVLFSHEYFPLVVLLDLVRVLGMYSGPYQYFKL